MGEQLFVRRDCVTSTRCCVNKSCYLYYLLCRQNKSEEEQHQFWKAVQCTVDKDVVRTDRSHPYFSGDNNPNVAIMRYYYWSVLSKNCLGLRL